MNKNEGGESRGSSKSKKRPSSTSGTRLSGSINKKQAPGLLGGVNSYKFKGNSAAVSDTHSQDDESDNNTYSGGGIGLIGKDSK